MFLLPLIERNFTCIIIISYFKILTFLFDIFIFIVIELFVRLVGVVPTGFFFGLIRNSLCHSTRSYWFSIISILCLNKWNLTYLHQSLTNWLYKSNWCIDLNISIYQKSDVTRHYEKSLNIYSFLVFYVSLISTVRN